MIGHRVTPLLLFLLQDENTVQFNICSLNGNRYGVVCSTDLFNPTIQKEYLTNKGTFSVQNMDQQGKIEPQSLTAHYEGFDVKYKIAGNFLISFEIRNNTNKSLIIDLSSG